MNYLILNNKRTCPIIGALYLLILICFCTYPLKGWNGDFYLLNKGIDQDTIPIGIIETEGSVKSNKYKGEKNYAILCPSHIEHHILIQQKDAKKMHIRLLNMGGQVLREQWTQALETDLYVKNLKGLFIVEIEYEGGVYSKTVVIN